MNLMVETTFCSAAFEFTWRSSRQEFVKTFTHKAHYQYTDLGSPGRTSRSCSADDVQVCDEGYLAFSRQHMGVSLHLFGYVRLQVVCSNPVSAVHAVQGARLSKYGFRDLGAVGASWWEIRLLHMV